MSDLRQPRRLLQIGANTLPASVRYRLRNWAEVGRWVAGTTPNAYDDAFWDIQHQADWPAFASVILRYASGSSLIDVGCGEGNLLIAIRDAAPGIRLEGVDGSGAGLRRAEERALPVHAVNLAMWRRRDADRLKALVAEYAVATCLETAEHLPPWSARLLVRALAAAPTVVFSAARPNQGGTLHMNERPFEYWERLFSREGIRRSPSDDVFRSAIATLRVPYWYVDNIHLLVRG